MSQNRDLRLAALNVEKVRAQYGIQQAQLFPAVNALGNTSQERIPADLSTTGKAMTTEQYGVNLGVSSWEVDFFGRIRSLKDQALEAYLATEQARCSAQIALVSEVAGTYLNFAANQGNLKLAQSTLESRQAAYALIQNDMKRVWQLN